MMVNAIEEAFDVSLDESLDSTPIAYSSQGSVTTSSRSETVGTIVEFGFQDSFQNSPHGFLDDLVPGGRYPEWSQLPIGFGNEDSSHRS